jgi:hypothetical protein
LDVEHSERVERELDRLIEKRHDARVAEEGERRELEAWQVTARIDDARKRRGRALDWYYFHLERAEGAERTGAAKAASHRVKAARLLRTELGGVLEPSENGHHEEST